MKLSQMEELVANKEVSEETTWEILEMIDNNREMSKGSTGKARQHYNQMHTTLSTLLYQAQVVLEEVRA